MTSSEFITHVKVKLNMLDTSSYAEVRPEEVLFFAHEALKKLTLEFDAGRYGSTTDKSLLLVYLASITQSGSLELEDNAIELPDVLKLKDVTVNVAIGNPGETGYEVGWQPTREVTNVKSSSREDNIFKKSYPDTPSYRLIGGKIVFEVDGFKCVEIKYDYLVNPAVIEENTDLTYVFMQELENSTVTLLLENLESRRLRSQTVVSKS